MKKHIRWIAFIFTTCLILSFGLGYYLATPKGGLTISTNVDMNQIQCEEGRLAYPRIQTNIGWKDKEVDVRFGWQCFTGDNIYTLHYIDL